MKDSLGFAKLVYEQLMLEQRTNQEVCEILSSGVSRPLEIAPKLTLAKLAVEKVQRSFCSGYGESVMLLGDLSELLQLLCEGSLKWEVKGEGDNRYFDEPSDPEMTEFVNSRITKVGIYHFHITLFVIPDVIKRYTGVTPELEELMDTSAHYGAGLHFGQDY